MSKTREEVEIEEAETTIKFAKLLHNILDISINSLLREEGSFDRITKGKLFKRMSDTYDEILEKISKEYDKNKEDTE